jgi:hypothetical protein
MMPYETLTSAVTVLPAGEPIYSEQATSIALEDEAAGLFVVISQEGRDGPGKVSFCTDEWPMIRTQIDAMMRVCEQRNAKEAT